MCRNSRGSIISTLALDGDLITITCRWFFYVPGKLVSLAFSPSLTGTSTQDRLEYIGETVIGGHTVIGPKRHWVLKNQRTQRAHDDDGNDIAAAEVITSPCFSHQKGLLVKLGLILAAFGSWIVGR